MTAPVVDYRIEKAGPGMVTLRATSGGRDLMRMSVAIAGLTPSRVANRFMSGIEAECLASCRVARVLPDWPAELRADAALWQRFRDSMAQMPRDRAAGAETEAEAAAGAAGPERAGHGS